MKGSFEGGFTVDDGDPGGFVEDDDTLVLVQHPIPHRLRRGATWGLGPVGSPVFKNYSNEPTNA